MDNSNNKIKTVKTINPATNELIMEFDMLTREQANDFIEKAHKRFLEWKETSFEERASLFRKLASIMRSKSDELARLCAVEMGKLFKEGKEEVELCANIFEYYAEKGAEFLKDEPLETSVGKAFISFQPIGVILSIQPWNFPFYQVVRSAAPVIMAGNCYVLKHASNVPQCAAAIDRIFREAEAPESLFTKLYITEEMTDELIGHKLIKSVTFTGSERAGSSIAASAGKAVKKTVLELGGSDPFIVLDDADIDEAVETAAMGRIENAGQVCTSPKRIIVMESVADEFIRKAKAIYEKIKIGDPQDPDTQLQPLVKVDAMEKVLKQVEDTVKEGATLVYGGKRLDGPGAFMQPTILTGIEPGMVAYKEEIFGPVLCIYAVKDESEAVHLANDTKYGLGASIMTKNIEHGIEVARRIDSGMVYINKVTTSAPELIFGGTKNSGYGRELSEGGIKEFVNHKLIRISSTDADY